MITPPPFTDNNNSNHPTPETPFSDFPLDEQEEEYPLDENGFPSFLHEEEEDRESNPSEEACSSSSFAEDFYKSGPDWSSLTSSSPKKLKQSNLLQMWGIEKKGKDESEERKVVKTQLNLFQMWGIDNNKKGKAHVNNVGGGSVDSKKRKNMFVGKSRPCPFYKKIPGIPFTVDAFGYGAINGCTSYFLSHFHADHYGGLSKGWSHGPIYCTPITARLVKMCLYVNPMYIFPLELDVEYSIEGVKVTLLEANHCPGAALIHFCLPDGQCYLHTGDFRASKQMQSYRLLVDNPVNILYLDTTYCNPKYRFPSKEEVMNFVVRTSKACLIRQPRTLIVVGAYSIGKESVYMSISNALQVKIFANTSRRKILQSFEWTQLSQNLCSNGKDSPLHVLPISSLRHETLKKYLQTFQDQFTAVVAFRPTGWTFSESVGSQLDLIKPNSKGNIQIYGLPYSEHSSFTELQDFVKFLKPKKIIPTVNISNSANREKMQSYFRQWLNG